MAGTHHLSISKTNLGRPSISISPVGPRPHRRSTITARVAQRDVSYWDSIHSDIDSQLRSSIQIRQPASVFEPMHHLAFAAPRTAASALCVAACELVGGGRQDALVAAAAVHLVHAAAYTHDHLPLTDRVWPAPDSGPRPDIYGSMSGPVQHVYGPNIELLTGDGIMPFAFELLARSMDPAGKNANELLRVIVEITRAAGVEGIVAGQDYGVGFDRPSGQPSRRLHGCGATCGAILGGGNEEEVERLKRYGEYVGKIEGLLSQMGENEEGKLELLEKWRSLALKELEYFDGKKIEHISTIVEVPRSSLHMSSA